MVNPATISNEPQGDTQPRKIPRIRRRDVRRNTEGNFCFSEWFIRLPDGLVFQDINDAQGEIWKDVQTAGGTALRRFDNVRMVAADESWLADGIVADANIDKVVFAGLKRVQLVARIETFVTNDGRYRAEWAGAGYGIFRRSDDEWIPMTALGYHQTMERAKHELMQACYPKNAR